MRFESLLVQNLTKHKSLIIKGNYSHRLLEIKTKNKFTMFATKLLIAALAFAGSQATRIEGIDDDNAMYTLPEGHVTTNQY